MNGDGKEDWSIGYPTSDNNAGRVVVMFGKSKGENFPSSLNIYSVDEDYGIIIKGSKTKIRLGS